MGAVVGKAANGIGVVLGNLFAAPFKAIFEGSCEDVCSGPWDVTCFIEHLCVSNLVKLLMILGLCYLILMFSYLLFKVGICQCIVRSLCKMCWAACETYWFAVEDITCFLWYKLKNTKRVYRGRHRGRGHHIHDIEVGCGLSSESDYSEHYHRLSVSRKRNRECRMYQRKSSYRRHHDVKLSARVRVKSISGRGRSSRQLQVVRNRKPGFKKRRIR